MKALPVDTKKEIKSFLNKLSEPVIDELFDKIVLKRWIIKYRVPSCNDHCAFFLHFLGSRNLLE